jgi:hypothetical protein
MVRRHVEQRHPSPDCRCAPGRKRVRYAYQVLTFMTWYGGAAVGRVVKLAGAGAYLFFSFSPERVYLLAGSFLAGLGQR